MRFQKPTYKCLHLNKMKLKKINEDLKEGLINAGLLQPTKILKDSFGSIKSGNDVVIISQDSNEREDIMVINTIQRLEKEYLESPRALIIVKDKPDVLRVMDKFTKYGKFTSLRYFGVHEKTNLDEDKNNISMGIDVLIGTPERLNLMFGTAGYDVNQLKILIIDSLDDLLRVRLEPKLYRLSESIGKTQRIYLSGSEYERLDSFVDKTMLDSFWFSNDEDEQDEYNEQDEHDDIVEN